MANKSAIYREIKPYVVKEIADMLRHGAGGTGGSGGGFIVSGAPTPHALSSSHHTGVLLDSQGPNFLLVDGSRQLTGNLSVAGGVTIDGVDLSVHVADPDAHHARATGGDGITVSVGQLVAVDSTVVRTSRNLVAGAGLTGGGTLAADRTFTVGAGNGIAVAADAVAVDLATNSGLTFAAAKLALGAPATVTVFTNNTVTTDTHAHQVNASSDVGTAPVESLLKSTGAGGLILGNLGVKGNVDVTNGGQLYVAGGFGGASGIITTAGTTPESARVGFGRIPDPQFRVDVNGPLRADYLIGKHAIQLNDAVLILHFDGMPPLETNFVGTPTGHRGQAPTTNNNLVYRVGKFNKAATIGEATTNWIKNPQFGNNLTDWTTSGTVAVSTEYVYIGAQSAKLTSAGGTTFIRSTSISLANGATVTVQARVFRLGLETVRIDVRDATAGVIRASSANAALNEEREILTVSWTNTTGFAADVELQVVLTTTGNVWVDACQMEVKTTATPYADGTMGNGHSWFGTAHASRTDRLAADLRYAAGNVPKDKGTVMCWFRVPWGDAASTMGTARIFSVNGLELSLHKEASTGNLLFFMGGNSKISHAWAGWDREWHHVAVTWNTFLNVSALYIDGAAAGSVGTTSAFTPDTLHVGTNAGIHHLNGWTDDFAVIEDDLDADLIRSIYESDAPVFAESSVFSFMATPRGLVWADENGLWMRDSLGNPVAGFYGGDTANYGWGGFLLNAGDIAFGRFGASDGGWFLFDRDLVGGDPYLSLGYAEETVIEFDSGGARIAGSLALTGEIDIGSGELVIDGDGITMRSGTGDVNRIDWVGQLDGNHGVSIVADQTGLGIIESYYQVGGTQFGIATSASGRLHLRSYTSGDVGPEVQLLSDSLSLVLRGTNSGTPPTLTIASTGFSFSNGAFLTDFVMAAGEYLHTDRVRALSASGLRLEDDAGNLGLIVEDGGFVGVGIANPEALLDVEGSAGPVTRITRSAASPTQTLRNVLSLKAKRGDAAANDYGPLLAFMMEDNSAVENTLATIGASRSGADNSGKLEFQTSSAGALGTKMMILPSGLVGMNATPATAQLEVVASSNSLAAGIFSSASAPTANIFEVDRAGSDRFAITAEGWAKLSNPNAAGGGDNVGARLFMQSVKGSAGAAFDMAGQVRFMARNSSSVDKAFIDVNGQVDVATAGSERGGLYINTQHGGADAIPFAAVGANLRMLSGGLTAADFKGAKGVLAIAGISTAPTAAPDSGWAFIWYDSATNEIKYRKPGGAATVWV